MRRSLLRFRRDECGGSAVEFAVLIGPLLLLVFGSIEFGRLLWTRQALEETAIMAARCMGVRHSSCAPSGAYSSSASTSYIQTVATGWSIAVPTSGIILDNNATCSGVSGFSQVTLSYNFQTAVPILLGSLADGVPITATACFPNRD